MVRQAGVHIMCLPAAYSTVHTWIQGFGLQPMPDEDLDAACKDLRLLIFPGTQVLHKQLLPPLPPKQGPLMTPPWAEEPSGPLTDEQAAVNQSSEPQQAQNSEAVAAPLPVLEAKAEVSAAATAVAAPIDMLLPVQTQPGTALVPPSVAAAEGAADDTPMTEHASGAWSGPTAAVEVAGDVAMSEPTTASAQNQAAPEDAPARSLDAASADTAQVSSTPAEHHDMLADVRPELATAEAESCANGSSGHAGLPVQAATPHRHLDQKLGTVIRQDDVNGKTEEASAATQDVFVQVHCSCTAIALLGCNVACTCPPYPQVLFACSWA